MIRYRWSLSCNKLMQGHKSVATLLRQCQLGGMLFLRQNTTCKECYRMEQRIELHREQAHGIYDKASPSVRNKECGCAPERDEAARSPERCNLFGCPAPSPEPFSAGTPAPACACLSREAAGDSPPAASSGPRSAGDRRHGVFTDHAVKRSFARHSEEIASPIIYSCKRDDYCNSDSGTLVLCRE